MRQCLDDWREREAHERCSTNEGAESCLLTGTDNQGKKSEQINAPLIMIYNKILHNPPTLTEILNK